MSSNKKIKFENQKQSERSGQSFNDTNEDSKHNTREEVVSLKQRNKELESENQILRAQNKLLRAHVSNHTLKLLQRTGKQVTNIVSLKNVNSSEDKRRDSFSHRVCDDLSEVILQFLPIKDKFRCECVSKQFQRTVFQRHYEFFITFYCRTNLQTFELILKKLPNIKSLKDFSYLNDSMIDLIIKYCNHLNKFEIYAQSMKESLKKLFNDKIRIKLRSIRELDSMEWLFINHLPNIEEISFYMPYNNPGSFAKTFSELKIKPKSLKKVFIYFYDRNLQQFLVNEMKYFNIFIVNNKSITHLSLSFSSHENPDQIIDLNIGIISQLSQLVSLQIHCYNEYIELKSLTNYLKLFSIKCLKLKSLSLQFREMSDVLIKNDFMSVIRNFSQLKRFEFLISKYSDNSNEFEDYLINSLKTGFKNLTHLTISFDIFGSNYVMNESFLKNISINLPNLQKLFIRNPIKVIKLEFTSDIVSRLSKLEVLNLKFIDKCLCDSFKYRVTKKCTKIKSIQIN